MKIFINLYAWNPLSLISILDEKNINVPDRNKNKHNEE